MSKKGKGKGKSREINYASPQHFNADRVMVYIEHAEECPIFKTMALDFQAYMQERFPDKIILLNRNGNGKLIPRKGAFEITFSQNARTSLHQLWSGVDKGPPRIEKFPESFEIFLPEITRVMKKIYVDLTQAKEEEENVIDDYDNMMYEDDEE